MMSRGRKPRKPQSSRSATDISALREHAGRAAALLRALSNENRLMILCLLIEGERSVGELNAALPLSQSALSQHLALLREEGLVETRREAQTVFYAVTSEPAREVISTLHAVYCPQRC